MSVQIADVDKPTSDALRLAHVLKRRTVKLVLSPDESWDIPIPDLNALATFEELGGNLAVFMGGECGMQDWKMAVYACGIQTPTFFAQYPTLDSFGAAVNIDNLDSFGDCLNGLRTPASPELSDEQESIQEGSKGEPFQGVELPDDAPGVSEGV